jgi:DNA-directed RNA polymerase specialized sigma24 family protein
MEKKNDRNFKKTEKATGNRYTHEDELFSVDIGNKITTFLEKVVICARNDYLRNFYKGNAREQLMSDLPEDIVQREYIPMDDVLLLESITAEHLEEIASGEKLFCVLSALAPNEKTVLFHIYVQDRTVRDTAALVGITPRWVQKLRKSALSKLNAALQEKGETK